MRRNGIRLRSPGHRASGAAARSAADGWIVTGHDIIVIGASAGGVEAIREIARRLPGDLPAAVFVAMHLPDDARSILPEILSRSGPLPAVHPDDLQRIAKGVIHVAPGDHHLLLDSGVVRVVRGPRHNRHRPAVDPMFRSAARAYGARVIGVVLTGALDDGTSGLEAIKRRGGLAVVQDPATALFPGMPQSALQAVNVDHVAPVAAIGDLLADLARIPAPHEAPPPDSRLDEEFSTLMGNPADMEKLGRPSGYACPECNGTLWEVEGGDMPRFQCRVGHSYTIEGLEADQRQALEASLWAAVRALEESASLRMRMADRLRRHNTRLARGIEQRAARSQEHARRLRELLRHEDPPIHVREVESE